MRVLPVSLEDVRVGLMKKKWKAKLSVRTGWRGTKWQELKNSLQKDSWKWHLGLQPWAHSRDTSTLNTWGFGFAGTAWSGRSLPTQPIVWCDDSVILCFHDSIFYNSMFLCFHDSIFYNSVSMILWFRDSIILIPWFRSSIFPLFYISMILWFYVSIIQCFYNSMTLRFYDSIIPWFYDNTTLWFYVSIILCFYSSMFLCFYNSMILRFYD